MTCANHPDTPVAAYCQFCGKPLCDQCVHKIDNFVGCEPCLAARLGASSPTGTGVGGSAQNPENPVGYQYVPNAAIPPGSIPPSWGTTPWLAFLLGWIPGVGAMYNGQFAKALAHVVIFALLVDFSNYNDVLGLLVAGWVFYQVFDAYQTAVARRDGLPLPNPLGLNDIAHWFGVKTTQTPPPVNPWAGYSGNPNAANENPNPAATPPGTAPGFVPSSEFAPPYVNQPPYAAPPIPPIPPSPIDPLNPGGPEQWRGRHGIHTGAVVLILLGVAFLLANFGILRGYWIERGWPILLIGLGVWMVIRHSQKPPFGGAR
jgi:hypothetical protein